MVNIIAGLISACMLYGAAVLVSWFLSSSLEHALFFAVLFNQAVGVMAMQKLIGKVKP